LGEQIKSETGTPYIVYSNIEGGWTGEGNINADPHFVNPDNHDYHLLSGSPCINTGNNSDVPSSVVTDLDGGPRIRGHAVDMGVYESTVVLFVDADAPGPTYNGSSWAAAFKCLQDALAAAWSGDEIRVAQGAYSPEGPLPDIRQASNPNPVDGSFGVSTNADLSWTAGLGAASHDVYFGTTSPGMFQGNQTATTFDPGMMAYGTTYYWRIDEVSNEGKTTGTIWSFTTLSSPPPPPPLGDSNEQAAPAVIDRETTFQLINGVVIKGGYAGFGEPDPNARDIEAYETILSGDLAGNDEPNFVNYEENSYHVVTGSGTDETAVLDGFTITAGNADENQNVPRGCGGGMYNHYGSPTVTNCNFSRNWSGWDGGGMYNRDSSKPIVTNCTFIGNAAKYGGGMYQRRNSNSTITNCTFSGNFARTDGGGMFNYESSSPILTNCTFIENSAENTGGGMRNERFSSPVLTGCTFTDNSAEVCGGGLLSNSEISPLLTNCTFINNSSSGFGGGMYNGHSERYDYSELTLMNCTFKGNWAAVNGGAIDNSDNTASTIVNCIFTGNVAGISGGGISSWDNSRQTLTNCTFSENSAGNGGGMYNHSSSPTVTNCILWGNTALTGPQIDIYGASSATVSYSDVQGGWPGQGNIDADPCFVQPNYLGPIAYWKLDEGSGTTAYDSVGQNNGTVYGAQWSTGQVGGALSFDGVDDRAGIAWDESLANVADNFTILLWAQPLSTHQIDPESNSGTSGTSGQKYAISARHGDYHWGSGHAGAGISIGTNGISVYEHAADYMPAVLVWSGSVSGFTHVAVVYSHKQPRLYIDGESKKTGLQSSKIVHILSNIGGHRYGYFNGLIDDVRIYDRALSADEIQLHYLTGLSGQSYLDVNMPDFHLLPGSPCISAGDPDYPLDPDETDLDGKPRVIGGRVDMGAYEFNHTPVANAGPDQTIEAQAPWGATVTLDGSGSSDADCTPGTYDDINDFDWYKVDPCDPNADVLIGSGRIIDCNLQIGEHIIVLEVIDRAGASDTNEVTIIVQDTTPPEFTNIPQDLIVECDGSHNIGQLSAWLAGAAAVDQCGDVTITNDFVGLLNGCGATGSATVTWTAEDESGNTTTTPPATFTIVDTTPPVITCPPDVTLQCPADTGVEANGSATAGDTCSSVTITLSDFWQPGCGNTGTLTRTWTATDECGNSSSCLQTITVVDTTGPEFELSVNPTMLWPPDHKMYEITPSWAVSDDCDASPDVSLIGIVANEGDDIIGDGHTSNDIQIGEDGSIYLRSERSGTGADRLYTITYQAVDDCGNTAVRSATVSIPHDFKMLARIASRWLWANPSGRIPEDLNGDGIVNLADFAKFAENWIK